MHSASVTPSHAPSSAESLQPSWSSDAFVVEVVTVVVMVVLDTVRVVVVVVGVVVVGVVGQASHDTGHTSL